MTESSPERRHDSLLTTRWTQIGALHGPAAEQAWQWFVERYRPFVRGILGSVLGGAASSAEAEFWGYVWLSGALQRAERGRRFRAFLSGIVRNFARTFARQRRLPIADESMVAAVPAAAQHDELLLWVENVVANALAALTQESPATGRALASFYGLGADDAGQGKSASEVAALLGNTAQGVYMLLFRGRKRMRELIEGELREGCGDDEAFRDEVRALLGVAATRLPGLLAAE